MLTFTNFLKLDEERSNPDLNPKIGAYEEVLPYADKDNYYISFTEIDKIGINPHSTYDTPNGIYTYPLKQTWKEYSVDENKNFSEYPFAKDAPFIWLMKAKNPQKLVYTSKYTLDELKKDFEKLLEYYKKTFPGNDSNDFMSYFLKNDSHYTKNYPAGKLWTCVRYVAQTVNTSNIKKPITSFNNFEDDEDDEDDIIPPMTNEMAANVNLKWANIFRTVLGYDGVVDDSGKGIIHDAEPIQAVFFSKSSIETVLKAINRRQINNRNPFIKKILAVYNEYGEATAVQETKFAYNPKCSASIYSTKFYPTILIKSNQSLYSWLKDRNSFKNIITNITNIPVRSANFVILSAPKNSTILKSSRYRSDSYINDTIKLEQKMYPQIHLKFDEYVKQSKKLIEEIKKESTELNKSIGNYDGDYPNSIYLENILELITTKKLLIKQETMVLLKNLLNTIKTKENFWEMKNEIEEGTNVPIARLVYLVSHLVFDSRELVEKKSNQLMHDFLGYDVFIDDAKLFFTEESNITKFFINPIYTKIGFYKN